MGLIRTIVGVEKRSDGWYVTILVDAKQRPDKGPFRTKDDAEAVAAKERAAAGI